MGAAVALFFVAVVPSSARDNAGFLFLIFAAACYWGAEAAVSQARLYRYGIEEALAVCSVGFLCAGISGAFGGGAEALVAATGVIASLWIWHRFGLPYMFLAAMIFAGWLTGHWTSSTTTQRVAVAAVYTCGLVAVIAIRSRYRMTYHNQQYSIAEALLWAGIYVAINVQLSPLKGHGGWLGAQEASEFPKPFYWATWVLIWCMPPVVLFFGLRRKDRLGIAVGAVTVVLTLATNKPYLGWQRNTWDPMLLGILLIGVALLIRRRLGRGTLHGFTAQRLSGKDKRWLNAGASVFGAVSPQGITTSPEPGMHFGGGDSGGGGASSDF